MRDMTFFPRRTAYLTSRPSQLLIMSVLSSLRSSATLIARLADNLDRLTDRVTTLGRQLNNLPDDLADLDTRF